MDKIIDCHVHHLDDSQVGWARELGYYKIGLIDWRPEVLSERMAKHPDFVIGIGWLPMWPDNIAGALKAADEFKAIGCKGYKICTSGAAYDDECFYPIWEKAQSYGIPCFFHTGWLDLRLVGTDYYPVRGRPLQRWYDVLGLDRIALDFPRLKLTAYHMGNTRPADCAVLMRNHPNVYADTCCRLDGYRWGAIGGKDEGLAVLAKLVVGTDGMGTRDKHVQAIEQLKKWLAMAGASQALQERIFYKTALRILGMDEELKKTLVVGRGDAVELDAALAGKTPRPGMTDFIDRMGEPTRRVAAHLAHDGQSLHMTFVCRDEHADKLAITRDGPVGGIWQDDSVEIFLSPTRNDDYFHIGVNSIGRAYIQHRKHTASELQAPVKARIAAGVWAVQMSVPFSALGGTAPKPGDKWSLNIAYNKTTEPRGHFTWMEIASTYHDPTSFGYMTFE